MISADAMKALIESGAVSLPDSLPDSLIHAAALHQRDVLEDAFQKKKTFEKKPLNYPHHCYETVNQVVGEERFGPNDLIDRSELISLRLCTKIDTIEDRAAWSCANPSAPGKTMCESCHETWLDSMPEERANAIREQEARKTLAQKKTSTTPDKQRQFKHGSRKQGPRGQGSRVGAKVALEKNQEESTALLYSQVVANSINKPLNASEPDKIVQTEDSPQLVGTEKVETPEQVNLSEQTTIEPCENEVVESFEEIVEEWEKTKKHLQKTEEELEKTEHDLCAALQSLEETKLEYAALTHQLRANQNTIAILQQTIMGMTQRATAAYGGVGLYPHPMQGQTLNGPNVTFPHFS